MITNGNISLRTLEPSDLNYLLAWENDLKLWNVSQTRVPFSKELLEQYISSAQDIFTVGQVRFIIEMNSEVVGAIDLFDFDALNQRAGVGLVISESFRNNKIAQQSIELISEFAKENLLCNQLYCTILEDNPASSSAFEKCGFVNTGKKVNWIRTSEGWLDALFYQKQLK